MVKSLDIIFTATIFVHQTKQTKVMEAKKVIVRTVNAGVFYGEIKERNGSEVVMTNVRRIWYWSGACSLSQLAVDGTSKPADCKFTVLVDEMTILGVIEIIPCSNNAIESIENVRVWKC